MPLKQKIRSLGLVVLTLFLASCASKVVLYPIKDTDLWITDKNDVCMSEEYFQRVLEAKIKKFK